MKNLEVKHLLPYVLSNLTVIWEGVTCTLEGIDAHMPNSVILERVNVPVNEITPVLRPMPVTDENHLKQIIKLSKVNRDIGLCDTKNTWHNELSGWEIDFLVEHHYDVFGLIPAGLAKELNN